MVPRLKKFQGSRIFTFQGSRFQGRVPRFQGSGVQGSGVQVPARKLPRFQGSRNSKVPPRFREFQGSTVPGFQVPRFQGPGFQCSTGIPEVRSCKGPGFQGSRVPRFQASRARGPRVPEVEGFKVQRFQGKLKSSRSFKVSRVPKFLGSWFQGSRVQGSRSCKVPEVSKFPGFQVPGSRAGFQSRAPGSRLPGFQGSKALGFQGSRVPFRILKPASPRVSASAPEIETQQALLLGIKLPQDHFFRVRNWRSFFKTLFLRQKLQKGYSYLNIMFPG